MSTSTRASAPLPIVIGVAGHRDLRAEDRPLLEKRVREILTQLQSRYRATPLALLSALREGADRLVARIALELGYRLIVPLPMPREEYVKDFPNSVDEFDALMERAEKSFTLAQFDVDDDGHAQDEAARRAHCRALAGAYIARHSQILLALWDGDGELKVGGTCQTVCFKREGVDVPYGPPRSPLDLVEGGPVYHLVTPRSKNPAPAQKPLALVKLFPLDQSADTTKAEQTHHRVFRWMNQFNRDANRLSTQLAPDRIRSKGHLFSEAQEDALPRPVRAAIARYAIADALAVHYSRRMLWTLRILLVVAFAATLVFQVYAYLDSKPTALLIAYLALAYGVGPLVFLWARFVGNYQNKYLDYRALAEGLRVHIFWRLGGLRIQVADHYLRKQRSEMDWIRQAIRVWTIPTKLDAEIEESPNANPGHLRLLLDHWIRSQEAFYRSRSQKDETRAQLYGYVGLALYVLGLILPVIKLFWSGAHPIIVAMSVTVVVAALVHLYSRILGFAEHAGQYARMLHLFNKGARHIKQLVDQGRLEEAQNLIKELGKEALIENGEWLLFHRRQPVQVPGLGKD